MNWRRLIAARHSEKSIVPICGGPPEEVDVRFGSKADKPAQPKIQFCPLLSESGQGSCGWISEIKTSSRRKQARLKVFYSRKAHAYGSKNRMEHAMQIYKSRSGITTVNKHLPFVWRVHCLHETPLPEAVPEIAHEKARQILQKNLSRAGRWQRS